MCIRDSQQPQIRAQLSLVLEGIMCQSLLQTISGKGRCMIMEILIPNPAVRNLIREDKIHQAVSYTHLDVYKRQGIRISIIMARPLPPMVCSRLWHMMPSRCV